MFREYRKATPGCNALKTLSITTTVLIQRLLISQISKQCSQNPTMEPFLEGANLKNYQSFDFCKQETTKWQFYANFHSFNPLQVIDSFYDAICDLVPFVLFKNVNNTHACNFTESNTPPWVLFRFFKLCKWYQI